MKLNLTILLVVIITAACGQSQSRMKVNADAKQKLNRFIQKSKFEAEPGTIFNGLSDPKLKSRFNELMNQAAADFLNTVSHEPTEKKFENNIKTGLSRFSNKIDTEDRERICVYFEELMDCVGLQSSNGQLNEWMYGFDPTKKN